MAEQTMMKWTVYSAIQKKKLWLKACVDQDADLLQKERDFLLPEGL